MKKLIQQWADICNMEYFGESKLLKEFNTEDHFNSELDRKADEDHYWSTHYADMDQFWDENKDKFLKPALNSIKMILNNADIFDWDQDINIGGSKNDEYELVITITPSEKREKDFNVTEKGIEVSDGKTGKEIKNAGTSKEISAELAAYLKNGEADIRKIQSIIKKFNDDLYEAWDEAPHGDY